MRAGDLRRRPRPDRAVGVLTDMMAGRARRLRDVLELRRGGASLGSRTGRHARGAGQARPGVRASLCAPAASRPDRTRSSSSPITGRPRVRRSSSATATASTTSSRGALKSADVASLDSGATRTIATVGNAIGEATGRGPKQKRAKNDVSGEDVVVLASGNLGLVYLMDQPRRMTLEEIEERHPRLLSTLAGHPRIRVAAGPLPAARRPRDRPRRGGTSSRTAGSKWTTRSSFSPNAARHPPPHRGRVPARRGPSWSGRSTDPDLDEGAALSRSSSPFTEALAGPRRRAFVLHPAKLAMPDEPLVGAAAVNALLRGWRAELNGAAPSGRRRRSRPRRSPSRSSNPSTRPKESQSHEHARGALRRSGRFSPHRAQPLSHHRRPECSSCSGVVLVIVSLLANFVRREALDRGTFRDTSQQLIANEDIRNQVAATMVDQLYANVDVAGCPPAAAAGQSQGPRRPPGRPRPRGGSTAARSSFSPDRVSRGLFVDGVVAGTDPGEARARGRHTAAPDNRWQRRARSPPPRGPARRPLRLPRQPRGNSFTERCADHDPEGRVNLQTAQNVTQGLKAVGELDMDPGDPVLGRRAVARTWPSSS